MRAETKKVIEITLPQVARRISDRKLMKLVLLLSRFAKDEHHRQQLTQVTELFKAGHPAIGLARRIFTELNPVAQKKLIENLGFNALWEGIAERRQFAEEHGLDAKPFLVVISPTGKCRLKCQGCYARKAPARDALTTAHLDRVISEGKKMGIYLYTLSGGEPFEREDLLDLPEKHSDCVFLVYTNGTRLTDKVVGRLARLGNVAPALSLEGGEEKTDARRGRGIYRRVMAAMDDLHTAGVLFGFSGTATRESVDDFLDMGFYDLMIEKGAIFGWLFHFMPVGKDATMDLTVLPKQRDELRRMTLEVRRTKPLFVADFWNDGPLTDGCMAGGTTYLHLHWDGSLKPCVFVQYSEISIFDLWRQGKYLWDVLDTPLFRAFRAVNRRDPNRLRPCPVRDHNEWYAEAIKEAWRQGGRPVPIEPGAEDILGRLAIGMRAQAEEYAVLAEAAWNSPDYDWARSKDSPIQKA